MLKHLSAPYVYHVFKGDRAGFVQAISDAIANPIQRSVAGLRFPLYIADVTLPSFVLERMTMSAVEHRLGTIVEHDWQGEAADLLAQRQATTQAVSSYAALKLGQCLWIAGRCLYCNSVNTNYRYAA
jgi:hypothetical protein